MRDSVLKTHTFESQSQLSRPKLRVSEVSVSFKTETGKLMMVKTETKTETRIWTIFETETTGDRTLDVKTVVKSLADL